jgi:hypothetical protein
VAEEEGTSPDVEMEEDVAHRRYTRTAVAVSAVMLRYVPLIPQQRVAERLMVAARPMVARMPQQRVVAALTVVAAALTAADRTVAANTGS